MHASVDQPVNQRFVLTLFHLLRRAAPLAAPAVTGDCETARVEGLVFALSLAPTIVRGEFSGFHLRTINPDRGALHVTTLDFTEFRVTTGPTRRALERLTPHNVGRLVDGVCAREMEQAVRDHISTFAGLDLRQRHHPSPAPLPLTAAPAPTPSKGPLCPST